jgi:hypothetical protein
MNMRDLSAPRKGGPIPDLSFVAVDGMKKCRLCLEVLPISSFCKMAKGLDRLETRCRTCNKSRIRKIRDDSPGYNRAHSRKFKEVHPEKRAAHLAVARGLRAGVIAKAPCVVCGNPKSESHHEDYSKPLEVIWFCRAHHAAHHEKLRNQSS